MPGLALMGERVEVDVVRALGDEPVGQGFLHGDVELPPPFVPNEYVAPTDVTVPSLCQGAFCI